MLWKKSSGKTEKITVKNEKGRLSAEEIQKMVDDAEQFKEDDTKQREKVEARNGLDNYIFSVKQSLNDDKLKDKFTDEDKTSVEDKIKEVQDWYDEHLESEKEEFESKQKELESVFSPIMMRVYQQSAPTGDSGGMEAQQSEQSEQPEQQEEEWEPKIEEVD